MGLLDILNGMRHGPRGQPQASPQGQGGGMSPIMVALLGLLAYKAVQRGGLGNILGGGQQTGAPQSLPPGGGGGLGDILGNIFGGATSRTPQQMPRSGSSAPATSGGGLGGLLGGLLGGAAAGSVLNGGLGQVLNDMQHAGKGQAAQSWVGRGENEAVAPDDLERALGADTIASLSRETGLPHDELLQGLSQNLPQFVDQLTPEGRLPTDEEAARW